METIKLDFKVLKKAVEKKLQAMSKGELFQVALDKNELWDLYLDSFPPGTNPIFRERREYDCQCCKQFVRNCGNIVSLDKNHQMVSIWDVKVKDPNFQVVVDTLSKRVHDAEIGEIFRHKESQIGKDSTVEESEDGEIIWEHFSFKVPDKFYQPKNIGTVLGRYRTAKETLFRALSEITLDAIETVLDLISQNSLYRGKEFEAQVRALQTHKVAFDKVHSTRRENYCWQKAITESGGLTGIRNSVIGTLLVDLSEGKDLEQAVGSYEAKVAPTNYKRPKALVSKRMIAAAEKTCEELGITESLFRRYAVTEDITINNVLFANRAAKKVMSVFDEMKKEAPVKAKNLKKVEEVHIDKFINDVLPNAESIELLLENKHENNLVSLIAPNVPESLNIFKWNNNFSWAYKGEVTDSIKERVKSAGGSVTGHLRCSLAWFNHDDLDIHIVEPRGFKIHYANRLDSQTRGVLDVDMNAGIRMSRNPVENITWPDKKYMQEGVYELRVNNYQKRETTNEGFVVEVECEGHTWKFNYDKSVRNNETVVVARFEFSKSGGIKMISSIPSTESSKEIWGINTNNYHTVKMVMYSPNFWDDQKIGNRHYFFMLEGCENKEKTRGFFNEYLRQDLNDHRKVFEILSGKLKAEYTDQGQLSGLGFSSTLRNKVRCRVKGAFTRELDILF